MQQRLVISPVRTAAESGVLFLGKMIDYKVIGRYAGGSIKVAYSCGNCGNNFTTRLSDLHKKKTPYCFQCAIKQSNTKHGLRSHPLYAIWKSMRSRCNNPNEISYKNYGGRGITICEEWNDFTVFMEWAESHGYVPDTGLTIDRIDNDKGYSPENCRWVDRLINNTNQRKRKDNSTGYRGVSRRKTWFLWQLGYKGKSYGKCGFPTAKEAALARDKFIKENNLPHTLNFTTN